MGLNYSVFKDETVIIGERTNGGYHMIANADFAPTRENEYLIKNLREAFLFLPPLKDCTDFAVLDRLYRLPNWLATANEMEYLTLNQVILIDESNLLLGQRLKILCLGKVQIENRDEFVRHIGALNSLKYLVHDIIFTPAEIDEMKKINPALNIMLAKEYEAASDLGQIIL
jgi:hypothetical protein